MLEIKILGSSKVGYEIPTDVALDFSAKMAGICYMPDKYESIMSEPIENTQRRVKQTLNSGHHSVYDHVTLNLLLTNIPKILAMVLNNEGMYTTSEKSARYTKMEPSPLEKVLYDKWYDIFVDKISKEYGERYYNFNYKKSNDTEKATKATKTQIGKIAQENARYMISVFTPTTMAYTVSLRQLNYIRSWFEKFVSESHEYLPFNFEENLKASMQEFLEATNDLHVEKLDATVKNRHISLFDTRKEEYTEHFDETYITCYSASFAQLAQAQRHRTLRYKMRFPIENKFYVPELIKEDESLSAEWLKDIASVAEVYPQGMMVEVCERGTYEDFVLKCMERLCGCAQLEIALRSKATMEKYLKSVKENNAELYEYMKAYSHGARCTFQGWKCAAPCMWGAKDAFTRKV